MARILILLAVVLGVIWWLRSRAEARHEEAARTSRPSRPASASRDGNAEAMVQCAQCGVHLPQSEAIAWRGLHYCRRSHLPDDSGDHA